MKSEQKYKDGQRVKFLCRDAWVYGCVKTEQMANLDEDKVYVETIDCLYEVYEEDICIDQKSYGND